jgi:hypothetical protein
MRPFARLRRLLRPTGDERLAAIERELRRLRGDAKTTRALLLRTQAALDSLLRHAHADPASADYPHRLTLRRFGIASQNGEDGILLALLADGAAGPRTFAEIAAGANGGNSGFLARELGWSGLMVDGNEANVEELRLRFNPTRVRMVHARVTRENVNALLREHGDADGLGLLSIDIDGNDVWVWEAVEAEPSMAIVEYNALFGPERSVAVPYDADFTYAPGAAYYGASLAAVTAVSARKGYRLVAVEPRGTNAFFLRDGVAPQIPETTPAEAFATLLAPSQLYADPLGPKATAKLRAREAALEREIRERDLPLVEIS